MKRKTVPPAPASPPQSQPSMGEPIRLLIEQQEGKTKSVAITFHVPRRELQAFIAALQKFLLVTLTLEVSCLKGLQVSYLLGDTL